MTDIEINRKAKKENILKIAKKLDIEKKYLECYGTDKAKIDLKILNKLNDKTNGKLILITSTNPTPYGEGKTTMTIGIDDAMSYLGYKSLAVLREPSLGPVFGIKGAATGGGYSQILIYILQVIFMQLKLVIIYYQLLLIIIFIKVINLI